MKFGSWISYGAVINLFNRKDWRIEDKLESEKFVSQSTCRHGCGKIPVLLRNTVTLCRKSVFFVNFSSNAKPNVLTLLNMKKEIFLPVRVCQISATLHNECSFGFRWSLPGSRTLYWTDACPVAYKNVKKFLDETKMWNKCLNETKM